jgi:hypothetical protein
MEEAVEASMAAVVDITEAAADITAVENTTVVESITAVVNTTVAESIMAVVNTTADITLPRLMSHPIVIGNMPARM